MEEPLSEAQKAFEERKGLEQEAIQQEICRLLKLEIDSLRAKRLQPAEQKVNCRGVSACRPVGLRSSPCRLVTSPQLLFRACSAVDGREGWRVLSGRERPP